MNDMTIQTAEVYLTAQDIAGELRIPLRTAYTYVRQMRHLKAGRHVRVSRASFEQWKGGK